MKRILIFFVFIYIITDSRAEKAGDRYAPIDSLLNLSYQSFAQMDIDTSLTHALEAVARSNEVDYSKGKARGNFYIAQVLWSLGEFGKTIEYLELAENEPYVAHDLILMSEICRVKGRAYGSLKLYDLSVREFHKGLQFIHRIDSSFEREYLTSLSYDNLAHSYSLQHVVDSTLHYLNKNKQLLEGTTEERLFRSRINLYAQLGKAYTVMEEYDVATDYFNKALQLTNEYNFPYTSWIYLQWGNMKREQGLLDSAIVKYHAGLDNLRQTNLRVELNGIYSALRDTYIQLENNDSALFYHQKKTAIEAELEEANIKAVNVAIEKLLQEEQRQQKNRLKRTTHIALIIIITVGLLALAVWLRWKKQYQQQVVEKEQELKAVIEEKLDSALDEVVELARENDSLFLPRFMELFPRFTQNIHQLHPDLSRSSFLFCAYVFLHFSSKEIAEFMYIEHKSVQTRKNRLRKQLGLPRNTDLYQYMRELNERDYDPDFF